MSGAGVPADSEILDRLLRRLRSDVQALSPTAVPLVGALVTVETGLPAWFRDWLMGELGQRVPLQVVTPAADAVMPLREYGRYADMDFALREIEAQYALLHALGQVEEMYQAVDFMTGISERISELVTGNAGKLAQDEAKSR